MRKIFATLAVTALVLAPARAEAQEPDLGDVMAYVAINGTHTGAFAPIVSPAMMGAQQAGLGYSFRYGRMTGDDAPNTFGAGVSFPIQTAGTLNVTAGYLSSSVDGVDGWFMAGANFQRHLLNTALGSSATANVGLDLGLGWGAPEDVTLLSGAIGLPISAVAGSGSWRFVPYVQPGFGWGRVSGEDPTTGDFSESGTRFMIGAGLGMVDGTRGIGINLGYNKTFLEDGEGTLGLGFTWNPRR